jgi:tape measure domain-containing protein
MPGINYTLGLATGAFRRGSQEAIELTRKIHAGMDALKGAGAGAGNALKGLSTALFQMPQQLLALKGILQTLSLPSTLAASAETTAVQFKVLIGDAKKAEETLQQIRDLAASTPFEFPELADAGRKLIAFGEGADTVAETLRKVGDVSSGIGAPIGEIAELYGKARVQGTLFGEDINQLMGRGIPVVQAFAKQLGVGNDEIKKMASEGQITFGMLEQAFTDLTSGSGQFRDMMQQTSTTMEGRLSSLSDAFKGVMTAVGEGINEALKPLVSGATEKIEGLKEQAKELGKELGTALDFAVLTVQTGQVGEVLLAAFKAGGLVLADNIVKAMDWAGEMLSAKLEQVMPLGDDKEGKKNEEILRRDGLGAKKMDYDFETGKATVTGLGSDKLTAKSDAATAALKATADEIMLGVKDRQEQRAKEAAAHGITMALRKQEAERDARLAKEEAVKKAGPQPTLQDEARQLDIKRRADETIAAQQEHDQQMEDQKTEDAAKLKAKTEAKLKAKTEPPPNIRQDRGDEFRESEMALQRKISEVGAGPGSAPVRRTIKGVGYRPRLPKPLSAAALARGSAPSPARQRREDRAAAAAQNNQAGSSRNAQDQTLKQIARDVATLAKNSGDQGGL